MSYISVEHLSFSYEQETVLEDISFTVEPGQFVILTGENGAAKSTLVKNILGLLTPKSGKATIAKKNSNGEKLSIGYAPQQISSFNVGFPSNVYELVASGRYQQGRWFKKLNAEDHEHIERSLKSVGMWDQRNKRIGDLSGGQKQRICLARIFATDPDLFVLDEPTAGRKKRLNNTWINISICNERRILHGDVFLWFHAKSIHLRNSDGFYHANSWIVLNS